MRDPCTKSWSATVFFFKGISLKNIHFRFFFKDFGAKRRFFLKVFDYFLKILFGREAADFFLKVFLQKKSLKHKSAASWPKKSLKTIKNL